MLRLLSTLVILAAMLLASSCKEEPDGNSDTLANAEAARVLSLGFETLDPGSEAAICENHTLMVYVGNAESMGHVKYAPGLPAKDVELHKKQSEEAHATYYKTVKEGFEGLQNALSTNKCRHFHKTKVTLLGVIDGPKSGDSFLSATRYSYRDEKWIRGKEEFFIIKDDALTPVATKDRLFEINMPQRLPSVIAAFKDRFGPHTQISYFLKTHGGLVSAEKGTAPSLIEAVTAGDQKRDKDKRHILLFDANGDEGELKSPLYSYYWLKDSACAIYAKEKQTDAYEKAKCGVSTATATTHRQGDMGNQTTQGDMGNQTTQGDMGNQTTQGDMGNQTTQGDMGNQTTQGDMGNQTTQGDMGNYTTQGDMGNQTTQGVAGAGTQGPGKSLMYMANLTPVPDLRDKEPDANKPDMIVQMGAVASYDLEASPKGGIYALKLELAEDHPENPTLIVLDSCYGSDQVVESAKEDKIFSDVLRKEDGDRKSYKICTMSNPKPTYTHTINYSLLDTASYLSMPFVFYWGSYGDMPDSIEQASTLAIRLEHVFMNPNDETAAAVADRYRKEGVDVEEIDRDYLKLEKACFKL